MDKDDTFRLILFDIDGTLLIPAGAGRAATRGAMQEVFGTFSRLETHTFGGKTDWQTLIELLEEHGYDETRIGAMMETYKEAMGRHLAKIVGQFPVRACPGALDLLQTLRRRDDIALGVVTGNVSNSVPVKLRAGGFDPDWFPVGAFGHESRDRNQLPALALERARQHYGRAIEPEQVIVVGDTPADVDCARALGAVAVAVATGFATRDELEASRPDYLLDDLTTFVDVVLDHRPAPGDSNIL